MRAAFIRETGPAENLCVDQLPDPQPVGSEVLVRVSVAALNPVDTYLRSGAIPMELPLPYVVGCDLAGRVEAVGPDVTRLQPGMRVWGSNQGLLGRQGTFAEYAAVDEQWLYETPEGVSDEQAAATSLVGITARLGLVEEANVQPGETVLVNGGGGAVGTTVIQVARALGARVIATTSSDVKAAYCRELGCEATINYRTEDLAARARELFPDGLDVWWETSRSPNFDAVFDALASGGRMVVMAGRDARPEFPVGPFYANCLKLFGFVMFLAPAEAQARAAADINRWLAEGILETRIARIATLEETAELHRAQEENTLAAKGNVAGKLLVRVRVEE
ncbi:NADPH:quinone reductase [Pirellulales bacterium]|nr:NADPH:quinone reductase [Pirellulales bacterium]